MLKYYVKGRVNPINKKVTYSAQMCTPDPVTIEAIAKQIAANCTLTRHDILACLSAFQESLIFNLQEGKSVRLGDLGCFRVTLRSHSTEKLEDFNSACVQNVRIRFTPAARLRKAIAIGADGVNLSQQGSAAPAGAEGTKVPGGQPDPVVPASPAVGA